MPAATVKVPTIFTAVDRFTSVTERMSAGVTKFADKAQASIARSNRWFNKLTPSLGAAGKQLLNFASAGTVIAGLTFGGKQIMDYEVALHSLQAVTGASYKLFQGQIESIAKRSKKSAVDVASSFEVIGSAMSQYLTDPKALGQITEAGITLAKAARQDLTPTLEDLTSIMNQFKLGAGDAYAAINRLTAGEIVGTMHTSEVAKALQEFGAGAKLANVNLGESVALVEVLGRQMEHASVGNAAKNLMIIMDSAKGLAKRARKELTKNGVNLNVLMDNKIPLGARLKELSKILHDSVAMTKVFGRENKTAGQIILSNLPTYNQWEKQIQKTNEAQTQAATNSSTVAAAWDRLKNSFTNTIVSGNKTEGSLSKISTTLDYLGNHMDTVLDVGIKLLGFFLAWKVGLWASSAALWAFKFATSSANLELILATGRIIAYTAASIANSIAIGAITAATWLWNAALAANPIVWIVAAVVAGIAAIVAIIYYWSDITKWFSNQWQKFSTWITDLWTSVTESFSKFSFKEFFMGMGKAIIDFAIAPLKILLSLVALIPGKIGAAAAAGLAKLQGLTANVDVNGGAGATKPLPSPAVYQQQQQAAQNNNLSGSLDINLNDPGQMIKAITGKGTLQPDVKLTSTLNTR